MKSLLTEVLNPLEHIHRNTLIPPPSLLAKVTIIAAATKLISCDKSVSRPLRQEIQSSAEPEDTTAPNLFKRPLDVQFRRSFQSGDVKSVFTQIEKALV